MMKKVLLIEDNPLLTGLYKAALEKAGLEVHVAHDGKRGIELAQEKKPDLIILDFLMAGMNGLEVLKVLKSDPEMQKIKAIMLTVSGSAQTKEDAKKLGVADYIIKSEVTVDEIVKTVLGHIEA